MEKRRRHTIAEERGEPGALVGPNGRPITEEESWSGKKRDIAEEQKEKLTLKEKLNLALNKLREIIDNLPAGHDRVRAEHTLSSVEGALKKLGKDGAPSGKYAVKLEGYAGNPQEPYTQNEGIPVDELIDILKKSAKEINKNLPTKATLGAMKKKQDELWERYELANEMDLREEDVNEHPRAGDQPKKPKYKHTLFSEWEAAKRAYEEAERAADIGYFERAKEFGDLADELTKNSQSYFEAHYSKEHGENADVWKEEERNRQDLRTRHEAKFISLDYRNRGSEAENYKLATDEMKRRRELKLEEQTKPVTPPGETGGMETPRTPGGTETPQPPVEPGTPKAHENLLAVDVSDVAEQLARQRATERLNIILNKKGISNFLSKWWHRNAEEMYRQRFIREELAKIQGQQNVFADPQRLAEHNAEMQAELQRFQEDLYRTHGGESKQTLDDEELNAAITQLIRDYSTGTAGPGGSLVVMTDDEFTNRKIKILQNINKKYPDAFGPGKLSADNFLEAGREFRKSAEHGEGLARLDAGLKVDLGIAKRVVRTDANLRWIDKAIANIQKVPVLSFVLNPTVMAAGLSVGTYLGKKPAYWLGGAFGAGAIMGGLRRAKDVKVDVATHRMERAMGRDIADYGDAKGRRINREKMEEYIYSTRLASDVKNSLATLTRDAVAGDPNALVNLVNDIADAEARMSLAETQSIDLIQYEGERVLSQSRLELLRVLAEAKIQVPDKGALDKAIADRVLVLADEVKGVNSEFTKFRVKESLKAAAMGAVIGETIGALVQEGLDKIGVHPPDGRQPALEKLWHYMRGERSGAAVPTDLTRLYTPLHQTNIGVHVPQGTSLVESATGMGSLVDDRTHEVLADNIVWGTEGRILSMHEIAGSGISLESHLTHTPAANVHDYLQANRHTYASQLKDIHRHTAMMNDTTRPDLNELQLKYGGIGGTGYDKDGNVVINLRGLKQFASFQGSKHPDIAQLVQDGKIKLLITPEMSNQHEGIVVHGTISANGETVTIPASASVVHSLFGKDGAGRLTHAGMLEAAIAGDDGKFTPIATDPDGGRFAPGLIDSYHHIFHKSTDRDWNVPPFIPIFPRKPLEDYKGFGDAKELEKKGGEESPGEDEGERRTKEGDADLPEFIDPTTRFSGKSKIKTHVVSRGQTLEGEIDLGAEYPNKLAFYTPRQIAEEILYGHVPLLQKDAQILSGKSRDEALVILEGLIQKEKEKYEGAEAKKRYAEAINNAYKAVDELMSKYGGEARSKMPSLDKIHLSGFYEFYAQRKDMAPMASCFLESGEIFINMFVLESMNPNDIEDALLHTVSHEIIHDAVANNYWGFETADSDEKLYTSRRSGLQLISHRKSKDNPNMIVLKERGRAINEAVTEELSLEAYRAAGGRRELSNRSYAAERRVLKVLQEKFKIDFRVFAEAVVNRRKLPALVRAMSKSGKNVNSDYVSMLMAIMDYESKKPGCRDTYPQTIAFIKGEQVNVDTGIFGYLGSKFLNKDGTFKERTQKKYNIKTWGGANVAA